MMEVRCMCTPICRGSTLQVQSASAASQHENPCLKHQVVRHAETTYIFFGKRGSGKTTIRMQAIFDLILFAVWGMNSQEFPVSESVIAMYASYIAQHCLHAQNILGCSYTYVQHEVSLMQMQTAYDEYNDHARSSGKSRGHFVVDLCRPGHLTICLRNFQERIKCNDDNWDAQFGRALIMSSCKDASIPNSKLAVVIVGEYWTSADIVDCIVSYTVTQLMDIMTDANSRDGAEMLARVSSSSISCTCSMQAIQCFRI